MKQDFELVRAKEEKQIVCPFLNICRKDCAWRIGDECAIKIIAKYFKPDKVILI
jgi:hypothetical protein